MNLIRDGIPSQTIIKEYRREFYIAYIDIELLINVSF